MLKSYNTKKKYLKDKKEDDELSDIPNDAYALVSKDDFVWLPFNLKTTSYSRVFS